MPHSVEQFCERLIECRLMSAEELQALLNPHSPSRRPSSGDELASELVRLGVLTKFQSQMVLQGRADSLTLGDYRILDRLGKGGMGTVFKARHLRMNRLVAIKVLHRHAAPLAQAISRFRREGRATARLHHPNVLVAHDAGEQSGAHYLVTEYLEGSDLAKFVARQGAFKLEIAVSLTLQAATGLAYAHQQGVIHRDIKPSNLFLTSEGVVKVLDFGVARIDSCEEAIPATEDLDPLTPSGQVLGTVEYMAPEQANNSQQADVRSDIYSLGCTLYFLLTGRSPLPGGGLRDRLCRLLLDEQRTWLSLKDDCPGIPYYLEAIWRRMIAREPADRFQTMEEFIAEIKLGAERGPCEETTSVGLDLTARKTKVGFRRQKRTLAVGALIVLMVSGAMLSPWFLNRRETTDRNSASSQRGTNHAEPPRQKADNSSEFVSLHLPSLSASGRYAILAIPGVQPPPALGRGIPIGPRALVARPTPIQGLRSWSVELDRHYGIVSSIAYHPSREEIATAGESDLTIRLWDREHRLRHVLMGHAGTIRSIAYSPDGELLASASQDQTARLWSVEEGVCVAVIPLRSWGAGVAFSPNGRQLAIVEREGPVLINLTTDSSEIVPLGVERLTKYHLGAVCWSPDGQWILTGGMNDDLSLFAARPFRFHSPVDVPDRAPGKPVQFFSVVWSPDGNWFAAGGDDGKIRIWSAPTAKHKRTIDYGQNRISTLAWSKDSRRLLACGMPRACVVWDAIEGKSLLTYENPSGAGGGAGAWSPDGREIAIAPGWRDDTLYFLDAESCTPRRRIEIGGSSRPAFALAPDGKQALTLADEARLWDTETGTLIGRFGGLPVGQLQWSPSGNVVALSDSKVPRNIWLIDGDDPSRRRELSGSGAAVMKVVFSPDGKLLASADLADSRIRIWDAATGEFLRFLPVAHETPATALAWSPDGQKLASAGPDRQLCLWDPLKGRLLASHAKFFDWFFPTPSRPYGNLLAWAADSSTLFVAILDRVVSVDPITGKRLSSESYSPGGWGYSELANSPDGHLLAVPEMSDSAFVRFNRDGSKRSLGPLGYLASWLPDSRRLMFQPRDSSPYLTGYDIANNRRLGALVFTLGKGDWACIGPDGHWRGSEKATDHLVYVAQTIDDKALVLSPREFAQRFAWTNEPNKTRLLALDRP